MSKSKFEIKSKSRIVNSNFKNKKYILSWKFKKVKMLSKYYEMKSHNSVIMKSDFEIKVQIFGLKFKKVYNLRNIWDKMSKFGDKKSNCKIINPDFEIKSKFEIKSRCRKNYKS